MKARTRQCSSHSKNDPACIRAHYSEGLSAKALHELVQKLLQSEEHRLPEKLNENTIFKNLLSRVLPMLVLAG